MMQPNQAANELIEDHVLNFLVNTLDKEINNELGENADIDSKDIWDVLVGATADEDSVSHLCDISENHPTVTRSSTISARRSNSPSSNESARRSSNRTSSSCFQTGRWRSLPPPTATGSVLSIPNLLPQRVLSTGFSIELVLHKQLLGEPCEVLRLAREFLIQGQSNSHCYCDRSQGWS